MTGAGRIAPLAPRMLKKPARFRAELARIQNADHPLKREPHAAADL